jgi:hypothetical protein
MSQDRGAGGPDGRRPAQHADAITVKPSEAIQRREFWSRDP